MTMVMSTLHRITDAALYSGTLLLAWGLVAAAWSENTYAAFEAFVGSPLGKIILVGYTWALAHHLLGGLRHFCLGHGKRISATSSKRHGLGSTDRFDRADRDGVEGKLPHQREPVGISNMQTPNERKASDLSAPGPGSSGSSG
jgi:succinate dehydrogenase cytochrome b556 subunit